MSDHPEPEPSETTAVGNPGPTPPPVDTRRERLLVVSGEGPGRSVDLGAAVSLTAGRSAACDVVLLDPAVSRRHARIHRHGGSLRVEDLGSRNGTFLNGVPVRSAAIGVGDRIQLGSESVLLVTHHDPVEKVLHERQKLEAIGRVTAGVSHDFNNLLAAAMATFEHLEDQLALGEPTDRGSVAECMRDLRAALERSAELTRSLARLGRTRPATAPESVDLSHVCEEVARLCERTFGPAVTVERRWDHGLWARAHRSDLHQVLTNLCLNARDALPDGGHLAIHAGWEEAARHGGQPWILVSVVDDGAGMTEEVRRQAFEPFFTTKGEGRGSGLGLSIVRELVRSIGGRVEVHSVVGRGTTFKLWLPGAASRSGSAPSGSRWRTSPPRPPQSASGRSILVVEDDELVRRSIVRLLAAAGHEVVAVADGAAALGVIEHGHPRPECVLLDLGLPNIPGDEVLRRLHALDPSIPVLIVSGQADPARRAALERDGAVGFLGKPFDKRELQEAVQRVCRG